MTQSFLPSMRELVSRQLRKRGMSQSRISSLLGTTQASVSMYLSSDPKRAYDSLAALHVSRADADLLAMRLSTAVLEGPVEGVRALTTIWAGLLGRGLVCDAHRALRPALADCDVCMVEYGAYRGERERNVSDVREAVKMLEASPDFADIMPEVSVNIASASPGAKSPSDVVAVPGRVVKVRGRARAMLPPEAGASVHMAKVLLLAMSRRPELRACINVRHDRRMDGILRKAGMKVLVVRGDPGPRVDDPTVSALETKLKEAQGRFDALVEQGGRGLEPNVYLFARGAAEAAELAIKLAREYSAD